MFPGLGGLLDPRQIQRFGPMASTLGDMQPRKQQTPQLPQGLGGMLMPQQQPMFGGGPIAGRFQISEDSDNSQQDQKEEHPLAKYSGTPEPENKYTADGRDLSPEYRAYLRGQHYDTYVKPQEEQRRGDEEAQQQEERAQRAKEVEALYAEQDRVKAEQDRASAEYERLSSERYREIQALAKARENGAITEDTYYRLLEETNQKYEADMAKYRQASEDAGARYWEIQATLNRDYRK